MSYIIRRIPLAVAVVFFLTVCARNVRADDFARYAAEQYRDNEFEAAYISAGKSSDLARRAFICGMSSFRTGKYEEAVSQLAVAEVKLPLIADYSLYFQAEALLKLKKYFAASAKAASIHTLFPTSRLLRRSEKLSADIQFEAADFRGALTLYQSFIEKYPSGSDAVDASFRLARCREELADTGGALQLYRIIWLNNPLSPQAALSIERLKQLERNGLTLSPYTAEELLKRAAALSARYEYTASLKTLEMIPVESQPQAIVNRIDLSSARARYGLRQYKQAEKLFARVAASTLPADRSEARFWLAKSLCRQDLTVPALALYLELAAEGKKQLYADNALIEAAGLRRGLGQYAEAARLFAQAAKLRSETKTVSRLLWDSGWCRYLAGEYPAAVEQFKGLLADESERERVLYWLGRTLEKYDPAAAAPYYRTLQDEFPAGFYATWYREQKGMKDTREPLGNCNPLMDLPWMGGLEKPRLLASLGLIDDARGEMAIIIKKISVKKGQFPALTRAYLDMLDYASAITLFLQNGVPVWEKGTLPLWAAGYPRAYSELVSQNAARNGLSEGLVYAMIRIESRFSPAVKSSAGAIGLMQMMPGTAKMTSHEKGEFNPQRLSIPEYNIRLGTKHLQDLMKKYNGDVIDMAAAYNAGSTALERWKKSCNGLKKDEFIENIPYLETRNYVKKVYASAATYRQLYGLK